MKILTILLTLFTTQLIAKENVWTYDSATKAFLSYDIVGQQVQAMVKLYKNGDMRFGIYLPYDQCFVSEKYPEPFGSLYVLDNYEEFKLQCLGVKRAVVFPSDNNVSDGIIDTLKTNGNVCLIVSDANKMCFLGEGINNLKNPST